EPAERYLPVLRRGPRRRHERRGRGRELYRLSRATVYRRSGDSRECHEHTFLVGRDHSQRRGLSTKTEYSEEHPDSSGDHQFGGGTLRGDFAHSHPGTNFSSRDSLVAAWRDTAFRVWQASHGTNFRGYFAWRRQRSSDRRLGLELLVALYGGYFGGGIGIMNLAMLSALGMTDIHAMNKLKVMLGDLIKGVAT